MSLTQFTNIQYVKAEIDARYAPRSPRRRLRSDSSLEITRRLMRRRSQEELHPGTSR